MQIVLSLSLIIAFFGLTNAVLHKSYQTKARRLVSKAANRHAFISSHKRKLDDTSSGLFGGLVSAFTDVVANTTGSDDGDGSGSILDGLAAALTGVVANNTVLNDMMDFGDTVINMTMTQFDSFNSTGGNMSDIDLSIFSNELTIAFENMTLFDNTTFTDAMMPDFDLSGFDMCTMMGTMDMNEDNGEIGTPLEESNLQCEQSCVDNVFDFNCKTECSLCSNDGDGDDDVMCVIMSTDSKSDMSNMLNTMVTTKASYQYTKGGAGTVHLNMLISATDESLSDGSSCIISYTSPDGTELECNSCEICEGDEAMSDGDEAMSEGDDDYMYEDTLLYKGNCANIDKDATNINLCDPEGATFPGVFRILAVTEEEVKYVDCSTTVVTTTAPTSDTTNPVTTTTTDTTTPATMISTSSGSGTVDNAPAGNENETVDDTPAGNESAGSAGTATEASVDSSAGSISFYAIATVSTIISTTVAFL